jgi:hypothetical protein
VRRCARTTSVAARRPNNFILEFSERARRSRYTAWAPEAGSARHRLVSVACALTEGA